LAKVALDAFFEQREVQVARFAPSDFAARVELTDADIETFYNANPALFQSQEQADVEYLVLDTATLQKNVTLAEAEVRAYYDQNASRLSGNEERRASHILLTLAPGASAADKAAVREKAATLLAQVKAAPQTFAEVAKANSQDPGSAVNGGDLDFFARGSMVKAFEDAAFALQKGAISDLVETEFGFHIIQLTDIKAPPQRSFESMRAEIEADLKKQQAQKLFADSAEAFSNFVYEQGDNLTAAAERFKLDLQTVKGLTRQPQPGAGPWANERLINAVFAADSIEKKRNTEAIETASGQLVSARMVSYTPARTRPLAEVSEGVRQRLLAQRSAELARETGAKQLEAWKTGTDAAGLSAALVVSRDNAQGLAGPVLNAALSADPKQLPAWVGVGLGEQGYAVVKVDKVLPRQPRDAQALVQETEQYSQWWSSAESLAYYDTLKERFKVQIKVPAPKPAEAPAR
jgi:peptidyl-prolyl cis-trans isomerase D